VTNHQATSTEISESTVQIS